MVEREVLKDIKSYKPKMFGPFTMRNAACIALAVFTSIPIGLLLNTIFVETFSILVASLIAAPILFCGFKDIYGLPAEKFFIQTIKMSFLCPTIRKYKVKNYFGDANEGLKETSAEKKAILKARNVEKKTNPESKPIL